MPNAMNMYAMKDTPGFFSRAPIMTDLGMMRQGVMDPQEFTDKYRKNLTQGTIENLIAYGRQGGGVALSPQRFAKFLQQQEMETAKEKSQQGQVMPDEYNAMRY